METLYSEFMDLTPEQARAYCRVDSKEERSTNSTRQPVRVEMERIIRDGTVIDVGCGNGIDAPRYAPDKYIGVDVSPALIEAAKQLNPGHDFRVVDATHLAFTDKRFDFAIIKSTFESVPSLEIALAILHEACRVAKTVLVAWHTPPVEGLKRTAAHIVPGHFNKTTHHNIYPRDAFKLFLDKAVVTHVRNFELWRISGDLS